jgi:hypothetical protein
MLNYDPIIPKTALKHGAYYKGICRNATVARWDGIVERFYHWRSKVGAVFVEDICCPEDDKYFDVFVAEVELTEAPEKEIPLKNHL